VSLKDIQESDEIKMRVPGTKKNSKAIYKCFHNSVTVEIGVSKVCAKIFKSGAQICGCKCLEHVTTTVRMLENMLNCNVVDCKVHLFNLVYKLGITLNLAKLCETLSVTDGVRVNYNRDEYSGLKVKANVDGKTCSLLVFSSGNIIISGCINEKQLRSMYDLIHQKISS
jgi:TATA-box binding protein (TBP) (component of TFIID and TFIIIB)